METAARVTPELEVGCVPDQLSEPEPPLAVHAVALLLIQLIDTDVPMVAVSVAWLLACRLTVGCCGVAAVTVTLVEAAALVPPAPVQVRV